MLDFEGGQHEDPLSYQIVWPKLDGLTRTTTPSDSITFASVHLYGPALNHRTLVCIHLHRPASGTVLSRRI